LYLKIVQLHNYEREFITKVGDRNAEARNGVTSQTRSP